MHVGGALHCIVTGKCMCSFSPRFEIDATMRETLRFHKYRLYGCPALYFLIPKKLLDVALPMDFDICDVESLLGKKTCFCLENPFCCREWTLGPDTQAALTRENTLFCVSWHKFRIREWWARWVSVGAVRWVRYGGYGAGTVRVRYGYGTVGIFCF